MIEKFPNLNPKENELIDEQREVTEKEIEMIEKSPLFYQEKVSLALATLGEKPVSWIDVSERYNQTKTKRKENKILNQLEVEKNQVQQILNELGLVYEIKKFKIEEETTFNSGYDFLVSKKQEDLSLFRESIKAKDDKKIGECLGYPETATNGFINNNILDYNELPKEEAEKLINEETSKFLTFRLSKDHWQEELEVVRSWQLLIKENFPNLYKEVISEGLDKIKEVRNELINSYK